MYIFVGSNDSAFLGGCFKFVINACKPDVCLQTKQFPILKGLPPFLSLSPDIHNSKSLHCQVLARGMC